MGGGNTTDDNAVGGEAARKCTIPISCGGGGLIAVVAVGTWVDWFCNIAVRGGQERRKYLATYSLKKVVSLWILGERNFKF
jgi:hypothetical protein